MKAELVPENGDPPIPIVRDLTLLGRHEDCDIVIDHSSLSKRHCLLVKTDGLLVIRDLATTNGTKVKGQRIRWAALLPEDRVSFGSYKMRIYLGSDEMPAPSEVRRSRNGKPGARSPAAAGQGAGAGLRSSSSKTELSSPSPAPRGAPPSFPEPSQEAAAVSAWDPAYAAQGGKKVGEAEPAVAPGGFEIVDDESGESSVFGGGFELLDDEDDEIVELE